YAAITPQKVIEAIKKQFGVVVKSKQLKIKGQIKEIGEYDVVVQFDHGLESELHITVSSE
ncbi:hypothetical protein C0581_01440, partial [Candidatus Parcubacteria bacterium]